MTLYLLRHAESQGNIGEIVRDPRLTIQGIFQASFLERVAVDLIICSKMKRCVETLAYSCISDICKNPILYTDLCRENMNGNVCNYRENEEIKIETSKEYLERINKFKELLREKYQEYNTILVVSHGNFISTLLNDSILLNNCEMKKLNVIKEEEK